MTYAKEVSMSANPDRLYDMMPVVYRLRDADRGYPLRALLQVIAEQVNLVEQDIGHLYDNWFIETCDDWVVPYIGGLIGYLPVASDVEPASATGPRAQMRERIMIPRREVANTIRFRRRKGTLAILEDLATAVAGWPAHAVEFYRLLSVTQNINYLHLDRGLTAELRDGDALDNLGGPFDEMAHNVDVRRVNSIHRQGRGNIPEVGVFVWRLKSYTITNAPAYHYEEQAPNCYLFSALGNDTPLYTNSQAGQSSGYIDLTLPVPITRRNLEFREISEVTGQIASGVPFYFGANSSFAIWTGSPAALWDPTKIVSGDLSDWSYRPQAGFVAVDPALGRMVFGSGARKQPVSVSYSYGFSADMGGGEYDRQLKQPAGATVYRVGPQHLARLADAIAQWQADQKVNAVIEITDSGVYAEPFSVTLAKGQTLQLRAAVGARPVLRLLDRQSSDTDAMSISGAEPSWFVLDGIVVTGRAIQITGDISGVTIRHSTLVPGWGLQCDCGPTRPTEPSLTLSNAPLCLTIEHSIVGAIQVERDEVTEDPFRICISDSIVDATSPQRVALGAPEKLCAYSTLTMVRSTVFGELQTHAIELAENCIMIGPIRVCRRQKGCLRFCYVTPGSRTPRRYECQPDLVEQAVNALYTKKKITASQREVSILRERMRVEPEFDSVRYGTPTYCRLANTCAVEITTGAEDQSELGAFHDLYQAQRAANLTTRLNEYTPAATDVAIIIAS
jgi:hypothetical protein